MARGGHGQKRWHEVLREEHRSVGRGNYSSVCEPSESVAIKLDGVRLERSRSFGAVWLGWILWRALRLDEQCKELLASKRETVSWAEVIAILVIGRLCEPSSELHVAEQWYRSTALQDLRAGLGHSPRSILTEFSRIQSADIVLPLADGSTRELRLRCVVRPDLLLQRLGLTLPERLRPPSGTPNVVPT